MPRPALPIILLTTALLALAALVGVSAAGAATSDTAPTPTAITPASAAQIDAYLTSKGSPMSGQGAAFVASGGRWQVDPRLLVAIAGAESNFGQITCAPFNAWGWGCPNGPYKFESWADGIDTVMQGLRTNYLAEGRTTVAAINLKYAPIGAANDPTGLNNNWTQNVSRFLIELGGDPNDIDADGIAGSIPLGPLGGAAIEQFGFTEETDPDADADDPALEVAVGAPRALAIEVKNSGSVSWRAQDVRLRRVDLEPRIVGAPFGALDSASSVAPGDVARFVVQLAAVGTSSGTATTSWRLEGPSGPFGPEVLRVVEFQVPEFVAAEPRIEVSAANGGVAGTESASLVVVHFRNAGATTWRRDGDDAVLLGLAGRAGQPLEGEGWFNPEAPARMLERSAAPGETASFAFRIRGEGGALALRPFRGTGWASGQAAIAVVGSVDAAQLDALRDQVDPPAR
ncbi:MAG: conjugal transfer protein [Thermoleophilia bacterium]|nr:conjugal transfer protein [Thermoleophilia bacterium]